ncbi:F-box protein At5g07610-like [Bidens hawaiensis]|uniref:F-box protein At5g07610-like n=1 Tax=Bidens hawaiensis TaxID=980011 RepID=UPI00404A31DD
MVNTRSRSKALKTSFSQASMEDSDNQSGALIDSNKDLLSESLSFIRIIVWLLVTSILRFKSVSKHWRLFLSNSNFTRWHDKLSKSPGIFAGNIYVPFDVENQSPFGFHDLNFYFHRRYGVRILQSCNGLLLCCSNWWNSGSRKYYVFNPTTKQLAIIPSVTGDPKTIYFMALAFHLTDCAHFKIVCIRALEPRGELYQVQIYSSLSEKWKISIESFSARESVFRQGVYWNRAVYWAPFYRDFLYFKIDDEKLHTLPLPEGLMPSRVSTMYLGESRGHLHLILHTTLNKNSRCLNVYEMLCDHSGWFVKYELQLDELSDSFPFLFSLVSCNEFKVIDVVRGDKEEDTFAVLKV